MKQCPYMARLTVWERPPRFIHARCERRAVLGSPGWHLHDAPFPTELANANPLVRVRWRSTNTPDYHVDYVPDHLRDEGGETS